MEKTHKRVAMPRKEERKAVEVGKPRSVNTSQSQTTTFTDRIQDWMCSMTPVLSCSNLKGPPKTRATGRRREITAVSMNH
jgi:hypothetical protein